MQRQYGCFLVIAVLVALIVGGISGAVVGGIAALSIERGYEPPVISAYIPTQTPTATVVPSPTLTSTPVPTETPVPTAIPSPTATPSFADIVETVQSSVVTVLVYFEGEEETPAAIGSGVALFADDLIITNHHVIQDGDVLRVQTLDDQQYDVEVVGSDFFTDIAVLRVKDGSTHLTPLALIDQTTLRPGDTVFTVGAALGDFRNSVTRGVVSGLNRTVVVPDAGFAYESLIQTDAAINPGNSGGPLLDGNGDVVGINTLVVRGDANTFAMGEGLGFAVPGSVVQSIAEALIANGEIPRPFFGIRHELVTFENAFTYGLDEAKGEVVLGVESNSPAAVAGIERGDVLMSINGDAIDQDHPFINRLMSYSIGDTIHIELLRDTSDIEVDVTLTKRE